MSDDGDDDDSRVAAAAAAAGAFPLQVPDFRRRHAHAHCSQALADSDAIDCRRPGQRTYM